MPESATDGINVLILSDPGLPTRRIAAVRADFERILQGLFGRPVSVHTHTDLIRISPENTLELSAARELASEYERIDATILLTEIPRHTSGHPLVAEVFRDENIAVLSCPTFGAWTTKKRILTVMVDAVLRLSPAAQSRDPKRYGLRWARWSEDERAGTLTLHAHTVWSRPRTVAGMVVANDPWRTAPRLSSALAAASATGAFGIFYHSIWQMSASLSTLRLLLIGGLAVLVMVAWLLIGNRLWDQPRHERYATVVLLYNLSTIVTLVLCMLLLYLSLVLLILGGALVVIDPSFMRQVIGHEIGWRNYLDIAWLSAAMGTVAGALGSSFDAETDLRKLTHGQRERQRRYSEDYIADREDEVETQVRRASGENS